RHPEVLWAQRSDKVYLTISLPDAKNVNLKSEPDGKFSFSAKRNGEPFEFELELFGKINPEDSKVNIGLRNIFCALHKTEKGWWKRLLSADEKPAPYIKVDWNKWCDEDEEESSKLDTFNLDDMDDISKSEDINDDMSDDEGML
ncbi:hypothetical protein KI387_003045, partial [Taxus chinensis]